MQRIGVVIMGGKYSITARNYDDIAWQYDLYTNNLIAFLKACIKCLVKYELVEIGIRK